MDNAEAKRLHKNALARARLRGFGHDAEDLAQEVLLKFCQGKGLHQTIDQAVLDANRKVFGDKRLPSFRAEQRINWLSMSERSEKRMRKVATVEPSSEVMTILDGLKGEDRIVMKLVYQWEFLLQEVANLFGVSGAAMTKRVGAIHARIKKRLEIQTIIEARKARK